MCSLPLFSSSPFFSPSLGGEYVEKRGPDSTSPAARRTSQGKVVSWEDVPSGNCCVTTHVQLLREACNLVLMTRWVMRERTSQTWTPVKCVWGGSPRCQNLKPLKLLNLLKEAQKIEPKTQTVTNTFFFSNLTRGYDFIDFRERERERETLIGFLWHAPRLGIEPAT